MNKEVWGCFLLLLLFNEENFKNILFQKSRSEALQ